MNNQLNCIFIGCFLYPHGYAATRRKQQFLDYIVARGGVARVLLTLKRARGHEMNDFSGVYKNIQYEVIGKNLKPNVFIIFTFVQLLILFISRLYKYKRSDFKNIVVAFGISWDNIFPLIFATLLGYSIVFDIVEDFSTLKSHFGLTKKLQQYLRIGLPTLFTGALANGISVISQRIYHHHEKEKLAVPLSLITISADNLGIECASFKSFSNFDYLYAGTFGEKEGLEILVAAFDSIKRKFNDTRLVLTGNCPGTIQEKLKGLTTSPQSVIFTGRMNDDEYYQTLCSAHVMMMTRTDSAFANAGFPYKLGEYLATGNPVICSNVSDISFYLENMKNAIIIKPDDKQALVEAMTFCYQNYEQARCIGGEGRKICEQFFNPEINSKRFYDLLQAC